MLQTPLLVLAGLHAGGWNTTISPRSGSRNRSVSRSASTRSPGSSVGTMLSLGTL